MMQNKNLKRGYITSQTNITHLALLQIPGSGQKAKD